MAAAIGIGEKEKDKDKEKPKAEPKGKSPEPIDLQQHAIEEQMLGTKPADDVAVMSEPEDPLIGDPKEPPVEIPKTGTVQTTIVGTSKPVTEFPGPSSPTGETSPKEQGRVSSWLKSKFSRRASRTAKDNEGAAPSKVTKSTISAPIHIEKQPAEPMANLPVDPSKATPGFGTDNLPQIAAATESDDNQNEEDNTKPTTVIEPITRLPIDISKTNHGFGTDEIPHIANRDSAVPSEAVTGADTASTTYSSTVPDQHQSRTNTNNSEREIALAGRSGSHQQHPTTSATAATHSNLLAAEGIDEHSHERPRRDSTDNDSSSISSLSSSDAEPFGTTSSTIPVSPLPTGGPSNAASAPIIGSTAPRGRTIPSPEGEGEGEEKEEEEFEEARDAFDTDVVGLPLPKPRFAEEGKTAVGRGRGSPVRETRFIEEL